MGQGVRKTNLIFLGKSYHRTIWRKMFCSYDFWQFCNHIRYPSMSPHHCFCYTNGVIVLKAVDTIGKNIARNGFLWSNVVFEKEVIFQECDFETSELDFEVSKSSIWKHTTSCDKGSFSFFIISNFDDQLNELKNCTGLLFFACWDTPSEKTGLWQLLKVSSVFNLCSMKNKPYALPSWDKLKT